MNEQLVMVRNISYSNSVIAAAEKVAREGAKEQPERDSLAQRELTKIKESEAEHLSSINAGRQERDYSMPHPTTKNVKGTNVSGRDYFNDSA